MNYGSWSFLLHTIYKLFTALCLLSANYYFLPFDTFNPLFLAKPVRLTTSSQVGGKVLWLCCAGLHVATSTGSAPCQSSANNTFGVFPCSYWIDNLGFITEGKLTIVLIIPSSWGSPTSSLIHELASTFSSAVVGESRTSSQGESLITNLFTLLFLFFFVYFCFVCLFLYQKHTKN